MYRKLHMGQGFNARPLEFRYAATFRPALDREQKVVVAGQRTLLLDGTDSARGGVTGYPEIDARIVSLRNELRRDPRIFEADIVNVLTLLGPVGNLMGPNKVSTLLGPVGNLMGQAVQDKRYRTPIDEAAFQKDFQSFLRSNSAIGAELHVQPDLAGGRVDLSFRGIGIELKAEGKQALLPPRLRLYANAAKRPVD
eukprot:gene55945-76688_t